MKAKQIKRHGVLLLAVSGIILLAVLYYRMAWKDVPGLVTALDHCRDLFCDFTRQYYPTGRDLFITGRPTNGYYYSSFFALWLVPFGRLALDVAVLFWGLFQLATILLLLLPGEYFLKESPQALVLHVALLAFSMPLLHNLKWGQISILVTGCILATLFLYRRGYGLGAAVLLGLATAVKYYAALFALYFLLRRQYRFLCVYLLTTAVLWLVIPTLVLGPETNLRFNLTVSERIAHGLTTWIPEDLNAQYVASVLTRVLPLSGPYRLLWRVGGYAVFGLNFLLLLRLLSLERRDEIYWAFALLFLSIPFLIETAWPHYFIYLPYCQTLAFLAWRREPRPAVRLWKALLLLGPSMLLASMPFFHIVGRWQDYSRLGFLFLANLLILLLIHTDLAAGVRPARLERAVASATNQGK
jgi:hypothetical protein